MIWLQNNPEWLPSIVEFLNRLQNAQLVFSSASQAKNFPPAFNDTGTVIQVQLPLLPSQSIPAPAGGAVIDVQCRATLTALMTQMRGQGLA